MLKHFSVIVILASFCCFLFGLWNIFLEVEKNACRMTYMFQQPYFLRVIFDENKILPNYGLLYYSEGLIQNDIEKIRFKGAPVLFIPGNGGSYKQVRSLASVALRKGMDNGMKIRLDFFTIDFDEELSGIFGGYLENQKNFLKNCIDKVLQLYNHSPNARRKVILIGHSMGGKIAQAVLTDDGVADFINSVIFISSPLEKPVVNIDSKINMFYQQTTQFFDKNFSPFLSTNETNIFGFDVQIRKNASSALSEILLISIGGGNRDLLVRPELTTSPYVDIHAMTSSIPKVWLSCDHLSSVWCLQLMLVVNRFLFSIAIKDRNSILFHEDFTTRIQSANSYFVNPTNNIQTHATEIIKRSTKKDHVWHEDPRKVFRKHFKNGLKKPFYQMIPLADHKNFKKLYIEVYNLEEKDWIYGCAGINVSTNDVICERGVALFKHIKSIPTNGNVRSFVLLDINYVKKSYSNWTHIVVRLPASSKEIYFNVDIYDPSERQINVKTPRWLIFNKIDLVKETAQGAIYYKLLMQDLKEPYKVFKVNIKPIVCLGSSYQISTKSSAVWARGFDTYNFITKDSGNAEFFINVPVSSPISRTTAASVVYFEIFLDTTCRYSISYEFSIAATMSKIVRECYLWLPSHLTAVLLIVLKNQIYDLHSDKPSKSLRLYTSVFQYTSLYIITGCRVVRKLLKSQTLLPTMEVHNYSFYVSIIVHSISIVISILATLGIVAMLTLHGKIFLNLASRLTQISLPTFAGLEFFKSTIPIFFGVLSVSIALKTCSGIGLIVVTVFNFILMSNEYNEYIEKWLWTNGTNLLKKACKNANNENTNLDQELCSDVQLNDTDASMQKAILGQKEDCQKPDNTIGYESIPFHITISLLLVIKAALNIGVTLAWIKNRKTGHTLPDPSIMPALISIVCSSLLWQINAPRQLSNYKVISVILYCSASVCIIYCQEAIYRLNYVIAAVLVAILTRELLSIAWQRISMKRK